MNRTEAIRRSFASKISVPRVAADLVSRPQLLCRMDGASMGARAAGLSLVVAPAGYGKTTLLAQWSAVLRRRKGVHVCWLNLDENDGDLRRFLVGLLFSLEEAGICDEALQHVASSGFSELSLKSVVARLQDMLVAFEGQLGIILDDYHRLNSEEVDSFLLGLREKLRGRLCITIGSRTRPAFVDAKLLRRSDPCSIGAASLRFTDEQMREVLGAGISDVDFASIRDQVEGWPVAIRLAKLLALHQTDIGSSLSRLHGYRGHIAAYLTDQVIAAMPDDLRDFVLQTSVFDRFSAEMADAVCGCTNSLGYIRRLDPFLALLVPLGSDFIWFRYHHLFAECLQDLLKQEKPDLYDQLNVKAAQWCADNKFCSEAVTYAARSGKYEMCADIITEAGGWELILFGGTGYLAGLLRAVPESEIHRCPRLLYAQAYLELKYGDIRAARWLYETALASSSETAGEKRDRINIFLLLNIYDDTAITLPHTYNIMPIFEQISVEDTITRGILYCMMCLQSMAFGELKSAHKDVQRAMQYMQEGESILGLNYCYIHDGMCSFYQGEKEASWISFAKASSMAIDNFGADSGLKYIADICMYTHDFWNTNLSDAKAEKLTEALIYCAEYDGWVELYQFGFDTLCYHFLCTRSYARAEAVVKSTQTIARERNLQRMVEFSDALDLRVQLKKEDARQASKAARRIENWYDGRRLCAGRSARQPTMLAAGELARYFAQTGMYQKADYLIGAAVESACRSGNLFFTRRLFLLQADARLQAGHVDGAAESLYAALVADEKDNTPQPGMIQGAHQPFRELRAWGEKLGLRPWPCELLERFGINEAPIFLRARKFS